MIAQFNSGLGSDYTYLWEFGDGQTSTDEQPTHEYIYAGVYDVRLTITSDLGDYVFTQPIVIPSEFSIDLPIAAFTVDVQSGASPLVVTCTDTSTGDISDWEWWVDDVLKGVIQAFDHTFSTEGDHIIKLKAKGAGEAEYTMVIRVGTATEVPPLISDMAATSTSSITGNMATTFSATVSGSPTSYLWTFGDGDTSNSESPTHTFHEPGTYTVTLKATNTNGDTTSEMTIRVVNAGTMLEQHGDKYIGNVKIGFYVVDSASHEVLIYKSETEFIQSFGGIGIGDGEFNNPTDIAIVGAVELIDKVEL